MFFKWLNYSWESSRFDIEEPSNQPCLRTNDKSLNCCSSFLQCVVCLAAKATMQTFPCGHKIVCRKCFIKTIQVAVSQRCLPLRCVICRSAILKVRQTTTQQKSKKLGQPSHASRFFRKVKSKKPLRGKWVLPNPAASCANGLWEGDVTHYVLACYKQHHIKTSRV